MRTFENSNLFDFYARVNDFILYEIDFSLLSTPYLLDRLDIMSENKSLHHILGNDYSQSF